jgi:hypothetical protein
MEKKYFELKEKKEKLKQKYLENGNLINEMKFQDACEEFNSFCAYALEKIMEENKDILKRLKSI